MSNNKSRKKTVESPVDHPESENPDLMRTMQLEDLNLGGADHMPGENLLDEVDELMHDQDPIDISNDNPLQHVDAISRRIEELTHSLQQPSASCDCHETADRMIEIDARLAKLQNEVKKQQGRNSKLETGLELIYALGNKIESLTDVVKLSAMEDEVKEDYHQDFDALSNQIVDIQRSLEEQPDHSENFSVQGESLKAIGQRLNEVQSHLLENASIESLKEKVDSLGSLIENIDSLKGLDEKLASFAEAIDNQSQIETIEQKIGDLELATTNRLDQLGSNLQANLAKMESSEQLADISQQLENVLAATNDQSQLKSVSRQLESLSDTIQSQGDDQLTKIQQQLEQSASTLQDLQQLNQLHELPTRLDQLDNQIAEVANQVDSKSQFQTLREQFSDLQQQLSAVSESLQSDSQIADMAEKFEKLHDFVKLGALEAEQIDPSRINSMAEQITAIGQMLVEQKPASGDSQNSEKLEALEQRVIELVEVVQNRPVGESSTDPQAIADLADKFDSLQQFVSEKLDSVESMGGYSGEIPDFSQPMKDLNARLDGLSDQIENQPTGSVSFDGEMPDYSNQIESLGSKLDEIQERMENQNSSPVSFDGDLPDYSGQIQELADKVSQTQETVNTLVGSLGSLLESIQNGGLAGNAASDDEPASDWEKQKQSILQGYGVQEEETETDDAEQEGSAEPASSPAETVAREISTPELDELRAELEEKLRRAEIDISIERAKIHQERRDLEELQNDLERRQQKMDSHGGQTGSNEDTDEDEGESSSGRWSRFLGN